MKVLVVGSGGREHALCWKLAQSPELTELFCAPGNPGIARHADLVPLAVDEIQQLASFASDLKVDLTVVGPELPLSLGIVDEFTRRGLAIFGPSQRAAEIEASKVFAKQFMERHGIPTAGSVIAHDRAEAARAARSFGFPVVLKADGLAAGKGVIIVHDETELEEALVTFFDQRRFGASGDRVLVEEFLSGDEISFMALVDGERVIPLASARDYKRIGEGDTGPNTGGMGAHSPAVVLDKETASFVMSDIMLPVVAGMAEQGRRFCGVLYAGLILTSDGPKVLEFNARFGDPESQTLLLRMEDDLLPVLAAGAAGDFGVSRLQFRKEAAACVVLAAQGYPGTPRKGDAIEGLAEAESVPGATVFHAGTARDGEGRVVTAGGRVLNVCGTGASLREALRCAYTAAARISWPGKTFRKDIGRAIVESSASGVFRIPPGLEGAS